MGMTNFDQIHLNLEPKLTSTASVTEATANANAQTASYVQADVTSIVTLLNSLKAKYNTLQAEMVEVKAKLNGMFS